MAIPRGKKRDSLGVVHDRQNDTTHAASLPFSSKEVQGPKEADKILQEEVRALGGTAETLYSKSLTRPISIPAFKP